MNTIFLATHNAGKIKELRALLSPISCLSQHEIALPNVEETASTFVENALIKARHACTVSKLPALADDSGLVVPALLGSPGVHSARFAGPGATDGTNIKALLSAMKDFHDADRNAYFYCALVLLRHTDDPTPWISTGLWRGRIEYTPKGSEGFGYDPIFYIDTHQCTAAELPLAVKNKISHRGQASEALRLALTQGGLL